MSATESAAPTNTATATEPYGLRWVVLAVVMTANIMDAMDATIANVASPSILRDLGGSSASLQWISAGYTLAFAVLLIAGARLGDIFGRRRVFLLGLTGFTLFSAVCAAAPSMGLLVVSRVLQGAFGALLIPQGFGFLKQVIPDPREFNKAMGVLGPATGIPLLAAPILAGALVGWNLLDIGWRLVFLINVPIGAVALVFAIRSLPEGARRPDLKLDIGGVLLAGFGLFAIIYPLIEGQPDGWPVWTFALLAAGVALLVTFAVYELRRRSDDALIEPSLLRNRTYLGGVSVVLFFFGAFSGLLLCVSLYGQLGEHWSPIHAGLTLAPMVVGIVIGMVVSSSFVERLGRHLLHIGILVLAAGLATTALVLTGMEHASSWDLLPGLLLAGAGAGTCFGQLFGFVLNSVNMDEVGSASGVLEAGQQLSTSLGVAVLGTIFFSVFRHHLPTDALQITAWASLVPLIGAFLVVFALPKKALVEDH